MENFRQNSELMGEPIDQLPEDETIPTHEEIRMTDYLFKEKKNFFDRLLVAMSDILIIGILFIVFSLPQFDSLVKRFIPATQNSYYILLLIKAVLFMFIFFLIKNFYLSRKCKKN